MPGWAPSRIGVGSSALRTEFPRAAGIVEVCSSEEGDIE